MVSNINKLISIVIPVYNTEKYLHRCIDSILSQTYANIEIILVDDGSTDKCPELCDKIAKTDDRITAIHQKNKGSSFARNIGIDAAKGDFVTFVDSDDWIERDTYAHCMQFINEYDADIVQFQLAPAYNLDPYCKKIPLKIEIYKGKDILQNYLYSTTTGKGGDYSACTCLFKKDLLDGVHFRTGKINEDIDFKYKAFSKANTMVNSNQIKYHYFQRGDSQSMGGLTKKDWDLYCTAEELENLSKNEDYGNIRKYVQIKKARTPLSLLCKIAYFGIADKTINKKETVKLLTQELKGSLSSLVFSPLPVSRQVLAVLFSINYGMTEKIIRIAKKVQK